MRPRQSLIKEGQEVLEKCGVVKQTYTEVLVEGTSHNDSYSDVIEAAYRYR
jgi:hypothetical protein